MVNFIKDINRIIKEEGKDLLEIEFETKEDYYEVMNYVERFLDDDIRVFGTFRDKPSVIFEREPDMIAEHEIGEITTEIVEEKDE